MKKFAAAFLVLVLLVAGGALALALFDWNLARDWVGRQVQHRTGRELVIAGDLKVQPFSLHPRVRAERVTFANAGWGEDRPMLNAESIEFTFSLPRLLGGRVVIPELQLAGADVLLQRADDGRRNWILKPPAETAEGRSPEILALGVERSRLRVKDRLSNTDVEIRIATNAADAAYGIDLAAAGRVRGVPLKVKGASGGLLRLVEDSAPYPIRLEGTLGDARASAKGTLTGVFGDTALDAEMTLAGGDLAPLGDVLKISLPHTKPYKLSGQLKRRGPDWVFKEFRGTVGRSDLGGDFAVNTAGARPRLDANLRSRLLDIADLGGFVGVKPGQPGATRPPGKLLPGTPYNLDKLRRVDARVRLVATRFQDADKYPLDNLDANLKLADGVFRLEPIVFGVAKGSVTSNVSLNAREPQIAAALDTRFSKLHLDRLIPATRKLDEAFGAVDGRLKLAGRGNSPATLLGGANGGLDLYSEGGEVSNLMLEFAGADLAEIVKFWVGGDRKVQLRCAVASFKVTDGVAASEALVVDTDDTIIGGKGKASLREETLDFRLTPLPKDMSPLALRGPLRLDGTFAAPKFGLEKGPLARKLGASVLLGLVNPLAAILPLIETGPGKNAPCGDLIASVRAASGQSAKNSYARNSVSTRPGPAPSSR